MFDYLPYNYKIRDTCGAPPTPYPSPNTTNTLIKISRGKDLIKCVCLFDFL